MSNRHGQMVAGSDLGWVFRARRCVLPTFPEMINGNYNGNELCSRLCTQAQHMHCSLPDVQTDNSVALNMATLPVSTGGRNDQNMVRLCVCVVVVVGGCGRDTDRQTVRETGVNDWLTCTLVIIYLSLAGLLPCTLIFLVFKELRYPSWLVGW